MKIRIHVTNKNPHEQHRGLKLNIVKNIRFRFYKPNPVPNSEDIDFFTKWKEDHDDLDVDEIVKRWRRQER